MDSARRGFLSAAATVECEAGRDAAAKNLAPDDARDLRPDGPPVWRAFLRAFTVLVFGVLPVALMLAIIGASFAKGPFLYDFNGGLYTAGTAIVRGQSPYHAGYVERRAALARAGRPGAAVLSVPVYPPPVLLAAVPFSLLPYRVAGVLFTLLSITAMIGGLGLLGVRDWRCFGVAFATWPVLHGLMLGALTPLLVLGVGCAWRSRTRVAPLAVSVATVITAKLFPWPLGVWLLATRRLRAAALAVALAIIGIVSSWALIGFAGMTRYPHMLTSLDSLSAGSGVSLAAALLAIGFSLMVAQLLAIAVAVWLLGTACMFGRSRLGERRLLGLAVVAALLASPIVWPHYFALAFVPVALLSPRLSPLWFVPLLAWLAPVAQSAGDSWTILPYLVIIALLALSCLLAGRGPPAPPSAVSPFKAEPAPSSSWT
jgi:hypothetical protein